MPTPISATQARKDFFSLLKSVGSAGKVYSIRLQDHPDAVLMSQEEYEGWQETLEILSDADLMSSVVRARKEPLRTAVSGHVVKRKLGL